MTRFADSRVAQKPTKRRHPACDQVHVTDGATAEARYHFVMLRSCCGLILTGCVLMCFLQTAMAQGHPVGTLPVAAGAYAELGLQTNDGLNDSVAGIFTLGAYVEFPRVLLRPGVDFRCLCGDNGVRGRLAGPRISVSTGPLQPYAELLAGPNQQTYTYTSISPNNISTNNQYGVTVEGVAGLDLRRGRFLSWRILEVTYGSFSGTANAKPFSLSTGLIVRIP